jgi:5-methylcytosine-specific restriction endonuclease McrA
VIQLDNWLMNAECRRLFGPHANRWTDPQVREWRKMAVASQSAHYGFPKGDSWWQHDHRRPLVEANGDLSYWQLDNIQTLCTACHIVKGREDNARRRLMKAQLQQAELFLGTEAIVVA